MYTFPSAHSNISRSGRRARCMEVVHHHVGSPKKMTIAQKDATTRLRMRMLSMDSGGGCFFAAAATFAVDPDAEVTSLLELLVSSSMTSSYDAVSRDTTHKGLLDFGLISNPKYSSGPWNPTLRKYQNPR